MLLIGRRKPEYSEKPHMAPERTCKTTHRQKAKLESTLDSEDVRDQHEKAVEQF